MPLTTAAARLHPQFFQGAEKFRHEQHDSLPGTDGRRIKDSPAWTGSDAKVCAVKTHAHGGSVPEILCNSVSGDHLIVRFVVVRTLL